MSSDKCNLAMARDIDLIFLLLDNIASPQEVPFGAPMFIQYFLPVTSFIFAHHESVNFMVGT